MKQLVENMQQKMVEFGRALALATRNATGLILAIVAMIAMARLGLALPGQEAVSDAAPEVVRVAKEYTERATPEAETVTMATHFKTTTGTTRSATSAMATTAIATVRNLGVAERVANPGVNAGNSMKIYKHMLYGHSDRNFGAVVKTLGVGSTFTVTVDGTEATYRVVGRTVYQKDVLNNDDNLRWSIYNYADGLTLMTCGNGSNNDSSQRLVLWAVRV